MCVCVCAWLVGIRLIPLFSFSRIVCTALVCCWRPQREHFYGAFRIAGLCIWRYGGKCTHKIYFRLDTVLLCVCVCHEFVTADLCPEIYSKNIKYVPNLRCTTCPESTMQQMEEARVSEEKTGDSVCGACPTFAHWYTVYYLHATVVAHYCMQHARTAPTEPSNVRWETECARTTLEAIYVHSQASERSFPFSAVRNCAQVFVLVGFITCCLSGVHTAPNDTLTQNWWQTGGDAAALDGMERLKWTDKKPHTSSSCFSQEQTPRAKRKPNICSMNV